MIRRTLVVMGLSVALAALGGCLVSKSRTMNESGVRVSKSTLNQVKAGETTEAWVVATLGPPTSRSPVDEQTEILRYDHRVETRKGGQVFLLFHGAEKLQTTNSVFFEMKEGVVSRYWTES